MVKLNGLTVMIFSSGRASISVEVNGVDRTVQGPDVVGVVRSMAAEDRLILDAFCRLVLTDGKMQIGGRS